MREIILQRTVKFWFVDAAPIRRIIVVEQHGNSDWAMVPLYAARVRDLGPGDFVRVECLACGHDELIPASALLEGLLLPPFTPVVDLQPRLRCRECDARGRAVVSIKWAEQP